MKCNNSFILLVILLSATLSSAQTENQTEKFSYGLQFGPVLSFLHSNSQLQFEPRIGVTAGFNMEYQAWEHFALRTNLLYTRQGYGIANLLFEDGVDPATGSMDPWRYTRHLHYTRLGIFAQYAGGKKLQFIATAGPYVSYLVRSATVYHSKFSGEVTDKYYGKDGLNPIDLGISLGGGLRIPVHDQWNITTELRGNMGLLRLLEHTENFNSLNSVVFLCGINYNPG